MSFPDRGKSFSSVGIQKIEPSGLSSRYNNDEAKQKSPFESLSALKSVNPKPAEKSEMAKQIIKALGGRRNV